MPPEEFSESQIEYWRQQGRMEAIKEARRVGYEKWSVKNHKLAKRMRITRADVPPSQIEMQEARLADEKWARDNPENVRIRTIRRAIIRAHEACASYLEMLEGKHAKFSRKYDAYFEKSCDALDQYKYWRSERADQKICKLKRKFSRLLSLWDELDDCKAYCQDFIKTVDVLLANEANTSVPNREDLDVRKLERDLRRLERDVSRYKCEVISLLRF